MRLVFLHGPPASGKYTIAQGLVDQAGVQNFHNHLTIDVSKSLFDFGTPEFWDLTHELRRVALRAKAKEADATVVFTNCYSHPQDAPNAAALERIAVEGGGEFLPVYLECSVEELRRRVGHPSRKAMMKLTSEAGLDDYLEQWNTIALPHPACISIQTDGREPADCVAEVIERLGLG